MQHAYPREAAPDPQRPIAPLPGDLIADKYRVECVLAESDQAVVLAAHDELLDRPVALKVMPSLREESRVTRFLREARTAARIESDHAVKILEVGTLPNGAPYMVLERLEGADLGKIVERDGPLPVERVADYALQACEALAHAHAAGIVHRDVKPQNLFLCRRADGTTIVKMVDFGIAKAELSPEEKTLTLAGSLLGSPTYMSPEQIETPNAVDPRSDVWSLGVVIYKLVSGRTPFGGATLGELVHNVLETEPAPLSTPARPIPHELEALVMRCLRRSPAERFPDVLSVARALAPFTPPSRAELVSRIAFVSGERSKRPPGAGSIPAMALGDPQNRSDSILSRSVAEAVSRSRLVIGLLVAAFGVLVIVVLLVGARGNPTPTPEFGPITTAAAVVPPEAPPTADSAEPAEPRLLGASPMPVIPPPPPTATAASSPRPVAPPPPPRGRFPTHVRPAAPPVAGPAPAPAPPAPPASQGDSLPRALGGRI